MDNKKVFNVLAFVSKKNQINCQCLQKLWQADNYLIESRLMLMMHDVFVFIYRFGLFYRYSVSFYIFSLYGNYQKNYIKSVMFGTHERLIKVRSNKRFERTSQHYHVLNEAAMRSGSDWSRGIRVTKWLCKYLLPFTVGYPPYFLL